MSVKLTTWHISGMSCPHCDQAILKATVGGIVGAIGSVPGSAQSGGISPDPLHLSLRLPA